MNHLFKKDEFIPHLVYLIKCLAGIIICYVLYKQIPEYPFYWAMVSVVVALTPDNTNAQAYNRIKANALGCTVGISLYSLHLPNLLILCIGVFLTIIIGIALNVIDTVRSALAALVIVILQAQDGKQWYVALERVICVTTGCVVALLLTVIINYVIGKNRTTKVAKPG